MPSVLSATVLRMYSNTLSSLMLSLFSHRPIRPQLDSALHSAYDDTPRSPRSIYFRTRLENTSPSAQCIAVGRPPYACAGCTPAVRSDLSSIPCFALHLAVGRPPYACAGCTPTVRSDLSSIPRFALHLAVGRPPYACAGYTPAVRSDLSSIPRFALHLAVGRPPYA